MLPNDYTRCKGNACAIRDGCLRFTCQNIGDRTPFMLANAPTEGCAMHIAKPVRQGISTVNPRVLVSV